MMRVVVIPAIASVPVPDKHRTAATYSQSKNSICIPTSMARSITSVWSKQKCFSENSIAGKRSVRSWNNPSSINRLWQDVGKWIVCDRAQTNLQVRKHFNRTSCAERRHSARCYTLGICGDIETKTMRLPLSDDADQMYADSICSRNLYGIAVCESDEGGLMTFYGVPTTLYGITVNRTKCDSHATDLHVNVFYHLNFIFGNSS